MYKGDTTGWETEMTTKRTDSKKPPQEEITTCTFSLRRRQLEELRNTAHEMRMPASALIRMALEEYDVVSGF